MVQRYDERKYKKIISLENMIEMDLMEQVPKHQLECFYGEKR